MPPSQGVDSTTIVFTPILADCIPALIPLAVPPMISTCVCTLVEFFCANADKLEIMQINIKNKFNIFFNIYENCISDF